MADFVYEIACTGDRTHEQTVHAWAERHAARFNRIVVIRNSANAGLGLSRNAGFAAAESEPGKFKAGARSRKDIRTC